MEPDDRGLIPVATRPIPVGIVPYGLCMYHSAATGAYYLFVNDKNGIVQQWELFDAGDGKVDTRKVRQFDVGSVTEGCVADDEHGALYVAEERVAIWRYSAEADGGDARAEVDAVSNGHLASDIEGLTI